jgi:integrase/recombinase XerC
MDHGRSRVVSSFEAAREALALDLSARWASEAQALRILRLAERFEQFCFDGFRVSHLEEVTPAIARAFVAAAVSDGRTAGASLQRARRSAIRLLFQAGRRSGITASDPTVDIGLPPLSSLRARPLTDDEVLECRASSAWSLTSARRSLTWALAEATCRSGEVPNVLVRDLDLDTGAVFIRGGGRCAPRTAQLTDWGRSVIADHLSIGADPDARLVYSGETARLGGLVSANSAISQVLQRAGMAGEPDVRPSSVVAWAGTKVLKQTGRIELVAVALGLTSLDRAASFIGWDWSSSDEGVDG